jgi:DNA mismatch repair protein MutS2
MATLRLEAVLGADGRLRHLEIRGLRERRKNPFFRRPLRRWLDRLRIVYHRYNLSGNELAERMVMGVYHEIAPALARVVQLVCHLEVYAASRSFAERAKSLGLDVCLPELAPGARYEAEALFNPLLMNSVEELVPTDLTMDCTSPINLVTGPNSGGKTRLLQAVGIAQVLAQSGLYTPCRNARLPFAASLFASIVEVDRADQKEGRLGTELLRLRTLFECVPPRSLVLLDELCSGTNPSEAIEIVEMVLRLLRQLQPVAFVTTHFLDFARNLSASPADGLRFLHAEVAGDGSATFRFTPGVAATSLAAGTAHRLGVTFEELEKTLEKRISTIDRRVSEQIDELPPRNPDEQG